LAAESSKISLLAVPTRMRRLSADMHTLRTRGLSAAPPVARVSKALFSSQSTSQRFTTPSLPPVSTPVSKA
jgi:hypothetical protein